MATIKHWRLYCETEGTWIDWYLPDGIVPSTCSNDSGHAVTSGTEKVAGTSLEVFRTTDDGSIVTKADPGTPDTDPKFYPYQDSVTATGAVAKFNGSAGKRMFGVRVQVKDAQIGDLLECRFALESDDSVVKSFGSVNAPAPNGSGWGTWEIMFGTSKEIPAGIRVECHYTIAGAGTREILSDYLMQE